MTSLLEAYGLPYHDGVFALGDRVRLRAFPWPHIVPHLDGECSVVGLVEADVARSGHTQIVELDRYPTSLSGYWLEKCAHSDEHKVPKMGAESPTNRTTTPYNSPQPAVAKADEKG